MHTLRDYTGYMHGNGWTQYLAVFEFAAGEDGKPDKVIQLIDFMPVGGNDCRIVPKPDVKTAYLNVPGDNVVALDVPEHAENDAPNFPTKNQR